MANKGIPDANNNWPGTYTHEDCLPSMDMPLQSWSQIGTEPDIPGENIVHDNVPNAVKGDTTPEKLRQRRGNTEGMTQAPNRTSQMPAGNRVRQLPSKPISTYDGNFGSKRGK